MHYFIHIFFLLQNAIDGVKIGKFFFDVDFVLAEFALFEEFIVHLGLNSILQGDILAAGGASGPQLPEMSRFY